MDSMTLVITNGDAAAGRLKALLGDHVDILPWQDVLHEGPVHFYETLEEQSKARAAFIAAFGGLDAESVLKDFQNRDAVFCNAAAYERVELWFEHDLYDQLQLMQILDYAHRAMPDQDFYLVQSDDYLAQMPDEDFAGLPNKRHLVSDAQKAYASRAWRAFCSDRSALFGVLDDKAASPLPFIRPALERLLQEYPDSQHGLPLSIYRPLRSLLDQGATIGGLFRIMQDAEAARFMGDMSFSLWMDELGCASYPLISGDGIAYCKRSDYTDLRDYFAQDIILTDHGRDVVSGSKSHVEMNGINRWIGGVHLAA